MNLRLMLTTAAAAAVLATPVLAETTGYVGALYGNSEIDTPFGDADSDAWGLQGAVATGEEGAINFQLDGSYTSADDIDADTFTGTGHLFTRQGDYAFGGFVGFSDTEGSDAWFLGLEGAKHFEQFSLVGRIGYTNIDTGFGDADTWNIGAGAEWQLEAAPVSFFAGYDHQEIDGVDIDVNTWTLGVRYNFGGTLKDRNRNGATFKSLGGMSNIAF